MPVVTPLRDPATLDIAALHRVISRVLDAGVHGIFLLGTTGEFAGLTTDIRRIAIEEGCSHVAGAVPVIVNVSGTCLPESLQLAQQAARSGASGVSICPPYYFPLDQSELARYVRRFCESVTLPVWLYNIPQFAHTPFESDTVYSLMDLPNVVGIKNSNGSLRYLRTVHRAMAARPDFTLLAGNEQSLLAAMDAGAHGGVCGGANVFPDLFVLLYEAHSNSRRAEAKLIQSLIVRIAKELYTIGSPGSGYLRGLKYTLSVLDVCEDTMAAPFEPFAAAEKQRLAGRLDKLLPFISNSGFIRK